MPGRDAGPPPSPHPSGLRIQDLIGLVVGFSLAALLVRTFGPGLDSATAVEALALAFVFVWLGLVMSGPIVLLLDCRGPAAPSPVAMTNPPSRYANQELAWLGIGGYFIALTLFIVPAQHRETPWLPIHTVQVIIAVGVFVWLQADRRRRANQPPSPPRWTRRAATWILITWPIAWVFMMLLLG